MNVARALKDLDFVLLTRLYGSCLDFGMLRSLGYR
jgi:hypothetical protein